MARYTTCWHSHLSTCVGAECELRDSYLAHGKASSAGARRTRHMYMCAASHVASCLIATTVTCRPRTCLISPGWTWHRACHQVAHVQMLQAGGASAERQSGSVSFKRRDIDDDDEW